MSDLKENVNILIYDLLREIDCLDKSNLSSIRVRYIISIITNILRIWNVFELKSSCILQETVFHVLKHILDRELDPLLKKDVVFIISLV